MDYSANGVLTTIGGKPTQGSSVNSVVVLDDKESLIEVLLTFEPTSSSLTYLKNLERKPTDVTLNGKDYMLVDINSLSDKDEQVTILLEEK